MDRPYLHGIRIVGEEGEVALGGSSEVGQTQLVMGAGWVRHSLLHILDHHVHVKMHDPHYSQLHVVQTFTCCGAGIAQPLGTLDPLHHPHVTVQHQLARLLDLGHDPPLGVLPLLAGGLEGLDGGHILDEDIFVGRLDSHRIQEVVLVLLQHQGHLLGDALVQGEQIVRESENIERAGDNSPIPTL